ncbi:MAG: hypothetical protein IT320_10710 [Anaerolineae bacterium]|nr:hypothetical protein [Anaerolineae bacterium]
MPELVLNSLRVLVFVLGLLMVGNTVISAVETFVVPRGVNSWLSQQFYRMAFAFFRWRARKVSSYEERDAVLVYFAPVTLVGLVVFFLVTAAIGFTLMYWGLNPVSLVESFRLSGSSLLTLGFATSQSSVTLALEFAEAAIGLILIAIIIAYLPTIYGAFSRREVTVAMLEVRAGTPPSAWELIARYHRSRGLDSLSEVWIEWERWFSELEETHTSLAVLVFFRSPKSGRSWITAAGVILDAAALVDSTLDIPQDVRTRLCIRAGYVALRHICDFFGVAYNPDPNATDPISITREEYFAVYDDLAERGIPLKADREQAWRDYAGWRVNYDLLVLALSTMTMAPYAPWISDRSLPRGQSRVRGIFGPKMGKQMGI